MQITTSRPEWVSPELYPFESHFFETANGKLHYIDEGPGDKGRGRPLVFIHGNPSWSFEFRKVVLALRGDFRCIAVDHLGFGLSDKALPDAECHPQRHAVRLRALLEHLGLDDVTLVMGDWGAAIGLDFALAHPERVSGLVITNSWAWPVNGDLHFEMFSRMMASPLGQFWIRYFNIFATMIMPMAIGVKSALTPEVMAHYRGPMGSPADRAASANLPQYILDARDWVQGIWNAREKFAAKPALVIWGGADIAFREKEYEVWKQALSDAECHFYKQAGHMPAEEIPEIMVDHIRALLARTATRAQVPAQAETTAPAERQTEAETTMPAEPETAARAEPQAEAETVVPAGPQAEAEAIVPAEAETTVKAAVKTATRTRAKAKTEA